MLVSLPASVIFGNGSELAEVALHEVVAIRGDWPDEGDDKTGPVLLQKKVDIEPDDTFGSLYGRLFPMGVEAMVEAVDLVREGKAPANSRRPWDSRQTIPFLVEGNARDPERIRDEGRPPRHDRLTRVDDVRHSA